MNRKTRRNVLKGVAVGTPLVWTKPIVTVAFLPAHAQTSEQFQATVRFYTDSSFSTEIPNGSEIAIGTPYVVLINLIPEPGEEVELGVSTSINGTPNPEATGTTNSEGELAFAVPEAGNNDPANAGERETFDEVIVRGPLGFDFRGQINFTDAFFLVFTLGN